MKKEKTVRTYQRRTKSGKMVTVREHKASYDAAEEARKAAAKKAGAGSELSKKKAIKEENPLGFSEADYKEWYHWDMENDANNEAALRVEKALTKKMGKRAYNKYLEDMSNSYSARGHKKAHQSLLDEYTARQKKQDAESSKVAKDIARSAKEKAAEAKASKAKSSSAKKPTSTKDSSTTTSTTGAGADWSKATVDKVDKEYGGGYTIVGTPNDSLWSSTNFRTKSQALDFIKRKQKESSAKEKSSSAKTKKEEDKSRRSATPETSESYATLKQFEGAPYRMRISKNGDPMPGEKQKLAKWKAGNKKLKKYLSTPEGAADKESYVSKQKEKERKAEERRKRDVAKWREKYTAEKKAKKEKFDAKVSELKSKGFKVKKRVTTKYTSYLKGVDTVLNCFVSPDKKSAYVYRSGEESPTLRKATAKELKIIIGEAKADKPKKVTKASTTSAKKEEMPTTYNYNRGLPASERRAKRTPRSKPQRMSSQEFRQFKDDNEAWFASGGSRRNGMTERAYLSRVKKHFGGDTDSWNEYNSSYKKLKKYYAKK